MKWLIPTALAVAGFVAIRRIGPRVEERMKAKCLAMMSPAAQSSCAQACG